MNHPWITGKKSNPIKVTLEQMRIRFPVKHTTYRKNEEKNELNKTSILKRNIEENYEKKYKDQSTPSNKSSSNPNNNQKFHMLFNKIKGKNSLIKSKHQLEKSNLA